MPRSPNDEEEQWLKAIYEDHGLRLAACGLDLLESSPEPPFANYSEFIDATLARYSEKYQAAIQRAVHARAPM